MRKLVFYGAISIDGYLADQNHDLEWLTTTPVGEGTTYDAFIETIDTTIMGRKTYEVTKGLLDGELLYPDKENYVLSRTLPNNLPDAHVLSEEILPFIQQLQQRPGKDIWIVGGGSALKPLLEADMIDEWYIQITPVLLGKGIRLFQEGDYSQRVKLIGTKTFGEFVELHYKRMF
ncbi:MAG: dihydrofolate reductase family protein [Enterococcus sp.]